MTNSIMAINKKEGSDFIEVLILSGASTAKRGPPIFFVRAD